MSNSYIIEIGEIAAGLIIRDDTSRGFVFVASDDPFWPLEGRRFGTAIEAERAARALLARRTPMQRAS